MGWRDRAVPVEPGGWRARAKPSPEKALADRLGEAKKGVGDAIAGSGVGLSSEDQQDLADVPGRARSALMGLTGNMGDRVESFVDAATQDPEKQGGWVFDNSDKIHSKYMADVEKHPGSNLVGAAVQPNPFAKMKLGARIAGAGALGAASSHAGAGPSKSDAGKDFASFLGGAGVQAGAEAASPAMGKLAKLLRKTAGTAAANAAGLRGGITNQAKRAGIPVLDKAGEESIPEMGNKMLDAGLIPFGGSKVAVMKKAERLMDQTGMAGQAIRDHADMTGTFSQAMGADAATARLAARIDPAQGGNLQTARAAGRAQDFIDDIEKTPGTFRAADDLKRGAYGNTNWSTEASDAPKLKRAAVSGYRQSMEDQIDALVPGNGKALHNINEQYGLAAQTADFAEEAAGREAANSKFGWGSAMLGATGFGAGGVVSPMTGLGVGVALPVAAHLAKTRGAAVGAPLARLGSKVADYAGQKANSSPALSANLGNRLADYLATNGPETQEEKELRLAEEERAVAQGRLRKRFGGD